MRRFSQRTHLVTLSEINITPLLDLAFVLLIIFVITTPLLEQGLTLQLPQGGRPDQFPQSEDVRTVELTPEGQYVFQARAVTLAELEKMIIQDLQTHPNLVIYIRADGQTPFEPVFLLTDLARELGAQISLRSRPPVTP
jgi:biopolymer transport protein ExbD